jgi:hypothetical protein
VEKTDMNQIELQVFGLTKGEAAIALQTLQK